MTWEPKFLVTGIGSVPFDNPDHAVSLSLAHFPEAPFWPQLLKLDLREQMEIQYSEGIPGAVIDQQKKRLYIETSGDRSQALAEFYETYLRAMDPDHGTGDCSALAIGPDFARGIYALEKRLQAGGKKLPFCKVQTTGPVSFALTVTDEHQRSIFYNEEYRDVVTKALAMKCRWQIQKFQPYAEKIICFIDEPVLSAFGSSAYLSVRREDVVSMLMELADAVHADNAFAGVHCCGNTEWSIPIEARVDLISFDAFEFGETIALYPEAVEAHYESGGSLAWGVVPTSAAVQNASVASLAEHLEKMIDNLASRGIHRGRIAERAVITPSCGTGSMSPENSEKVFGLAQELSRVLRKKYGFEK